MASAVAALYHHVRARTSWTKSQAAQTFARKFGKSLSVVLVVVLLIVYIAIGGGIFMIWEDWNFLGIFMAPIYFCGSVLLWPWDQELADALHATRSLAHVWSIHPQMPWNIHSYTTSSWSLFVALDRILLLLLHHDDHHWLRRSCPRYTIRPYGFFLFHFSAWHNERREERAEWEN